MGRCDLIEGQSDDLDDILRHLDPGVATRPGLDGRAGAALRELWRRGVPVSAKRALIAVRQRIWHRLEARQFAASARSTAISPSPTTTCTAPSGSTGRARAVRARQGR